MRVSHIIGAIAAVAIMVLLYLFTVSGAGYLLERSGNLDSGYISVIKVVGLLVFLASVIAMLLKKRR